MHRSLSVKEVLLYQGHLRLPPSVSKDEISQRVDHVCIMTISYAPLKVISVSLSASLMMLALFPFI